MIKFIYFDLGDVCFTYPHAFRGVAKQFGHTEEDYHRIFVQNGKMLGKGKMTIDELWQVMRKELNIKNGADFDFSEYWADQYIPRPEMHELVIETGRKVRIGLLTNNFPGMRPRLIKRKLIPDANYSVIIFSNEIGYKKPEAEIYEIARKKADVAPAEILLVDDRQDFVEGAQKAGWNVIKFNIANPAESIQQVRDILEKIT